MFEFGSIEFLNESVALSSIAVIIVASFDQIVGNLMFGQLSYPTLKNFENSISLGFVAIFDKFLDKERCIF